MQSFIVHLVRIKLYVHDGHVLGHPDIVLWNSVDSFRYILQDKVKVQLIFLCSWEETVPQLNNIRMVK